MNKRQASQLLRVIAAEMQMPESDPAVRVAVWAEELYEIADHIDPEEER